MNGYSAIANGSRVAAGASPARPMRVLVVTEHFLPAADWGGPVRSIANLVRGLADLGVDVRVVTTNASQRGVAGESGRTVEGGITTWRLPVLGRGRLARANRWGVSLPYVHRAFAEVAGADVVHLEGVWGAANAVVAWRCRRLGRPYLICPRGNLEQRSLDVKSWRKRAYLSVFGRRDLSQAAAIQFTSDLERRLAPWWVRRLRAFVVPNPVDISRPGDGATFRWRLEATADEFLIGIVGRIHPRKGFDVLLPAFRRACERRNCRLVVVGPEEDGGEVRRMVGALALHGRIAFLGLLDETQLADAYAGIDLLAVPSKGESFGNVVLEAVGRGTPVAVADGIGVCDWVGANRAGRIVTGGQESWTAVLLEAAPRGAVPEGERNRLRNLVHAEFSIPAVARRMLHAYRQVSDRNPSTLS